MMPTLPYLHVDAFTRKPFGGNSCAVFFETDDLNDETLQVIAREMNLAETAFVRRSDIADFGVRYFTPAEEIPMAGHPTIATTFALVGSGRLLITGDTTITLELKVGPIEVAIQTENGAVHNIVMTQKKPVFGTIHDPSLVMPLFGLSEDDLIPGMRIQTVSTGTPQLMLPLRDKQALKKARMNAAAYDAYRAGSDFFSPHLFCLGGYTSEARTFARHFGSPPDLPEDSFTGSATGGMAAYCRRYGLIETTFFIAEQGHWMGRPGQAHVEVVGPPDAIEAVHVGGPAVTLMRGEISF